MKTVEEPLVTIPGPAGTQDGSIQGVVMLPTWAAGIPPIRTFIAPVIMVRGTAGWGTGVGTGAGG